MRVHLCGVRGSTPAVGAAFVDVGGHTSCVAIAHSAVDYPVELGRRSGAKTVVLFHHDPDRTDTEVAAIERSFRYTADLSVVAAREGVVYRLG